LVPSMVNRFRCSLRIQDLRISGDGPEGNDLGKSSGVESSDETLTFDIAADWTIQASAPETNKLIGGTFLAWVTDCCYATSSGARV
jgi:hypothetical protein